DFKDRSGRDVGRSVSAWGFWADALNGPYHCFGTLSEEPSFYKMTNKQYCRTAVDLAEHNVLALLHELRTGEPLALGAGGEAHRAKVARGPTSMADLTATAAADAKQHHQQQQQGQGAAVAA
ncbi:Dynein assembly factor 3, axonemal, partial [Tetrabaena socialis]